MFVCSQKIIEANSPDEILEMARELIRQKKELTQKYKTPFIKGHKSKVKYYLNSFERHMEKKGHLNLAGRYSLTPCVFELLAFTTEEPEFSEGKNYFFIGVTACEKNFKVIMRKKKDGYELRSYYRV